MNKMFYSKLAFSNIKKNAKFNIPYIIATMITIIMYYTMQAITDNSQMKRMPSADNLKILMQLGCVVVAIFAVIFLFYTNSFLMKRRKKEIGLYNILGMEKKHIGKILSIETIYMFLISVVSGLTIAILFNRLIIMVFAKVVKYDIVIKFEICKSGVISTFVLFLGIYILTLIYNFAKIQIAKPIELLRGGKVGEKEPKTKIILTIIGVACITTAYIIANTVKSPLDALYLFFVAVILVIIGTYALFIAGSIAVLKLLKKNKKYYYQTKHFTNVSGMIYRMKQNAAGLANICILSTMVLVIVSTSVSMYIGVDDALKYRFPSDITMYTMYGNSNELTDNDSLIKLKEKTNKVIKDQGRKIENSSSYVDMYFPVENKNNEYLALKNSSLYNADSHVLDIITLCDYNEMTGQHEKLNKDEIIVCDKKTKITANPVINGSKFKIKKRISKMPIVSDASDEILIVHYIIVSNKEVMKNMYDSAKERMKQGYPEAKGKYEFDIDGSDLQKIACYNKIVKATSVKTKNGENTYNTSYSECRQASREDFYQMYGCLLFLGIFLGIIFLVATVLIIYYKQISEGYDDKERFEIMQKVGMGKKEIKSTIKSQVLTVFFLPIIVAAVHVLAAFNIIVKLLAMMNLTNVTLFAWCTLGTIVAFAVFYGIIYSLTAKVYYKIVG